MIHHELSTDVYIKHGQLLCSSYLYWTGKQLIPTQKNDNDFILTLYNAPFVVVSHGLEDTAIFNFGNEMALDLFELDWKSFIKMPSKESVEIINQVEREKLIQQVAKDGFLDNYSGIRLSSSDRRFLIQGAIIWNIIDDSGAYYGQAAMFESWLHQ